MHCCCSLLPLLSLSPSLPLHLVFSSDTLSSSSSLLATETELLLQLLLAASEVESAGVGVVGQQPLPLCITLPAASSRLLPSDGSGSSSLLRCWAGPASWRRKEEEESPLDSSASEGGEIRQEEGEEAEEELRPPQREAAAAASDAVAAAAAVVGLCCDEQLL
jgi:hypothetical protein